MNGALLTTAQRMERVRARRPLPKEDALAVLEELAGGAWATPASVQSWAVRTLLADLRPRDPMYLDEPRPPREPGDDDDDPLASDDGQTVPLGDVLDELHAQTVLGFAPRPQRATIMDSMEREAALERRQDQRRAATVAWIERVGRAIRAVHDEALDDVTISGPLASDDDRKRLRFFEHALGVVRNAFGRARTEQRRWQSRTES